jgi:hypothetical protein
MEVRLFGEAAAMVAKPQRRFGLCDYQSWSPSAVVESAFDIDVRRWQRRGLLVPGMTFLCHWAVWLAFSYRIAWLTGQVESDDRVRLTYRVRMPRKRWQNLDQEVSLVWDSCRYGGRRPWFLCPHCGQSVAVLYLGGRSISFCCRQCAGLKYRSQDGGTRLRLMRKAEKIRSRLGGSPSVWIPFPDKPRTMRWSRYLRLRETAERAEEEWLRRSAYLFRALGSDEAL